jgi:phosphohistidine phosphatase
MELLIVRHALAADRAEFAATGQSDQLRPLTDRGRRHMQQIVQALRRLVPVIDVIATSPLTRAIQTGEILAGAYEGPGLIQLPSLVPGTRAEDLGRWLATQPDAASLALVGHEPQLSALIAWLTAGHGRSFVRLGKGAACMLDCPAPADAGCGEIEWLLQPGQLRMLCV